jgi:hypothetical protein
MPTRSRVLFSVWLLLAWILLAEPAVSDPAAEQRAVEAIRRAASASAADLEDRPLPLAASWNVGDIVTGFGPAYQIAEIAQGQYLLPWFGLSVPRPPPGAPSNYPATTDAPHYFDSAIRYLAEHHLPLSFETTQFEALLSEVSPEYPQRGPDGKPLALTPFGSIAPWYAVGRMWAHHPTLRRLQELYPDPPLVLFISNNERIKLTPQELRAAFNEHASPDLVARRRAIGDAWIERYRTMERGWRDGLEARLWREHAVFVGYDAFVTPAIGRWGGWTQYSLCVPGRTEPWPYAWDGATVSYYLHDWAPDTDFTVWSPQIEAMNFPLVLAEVRRAQPRFWFELSVWDGQRPGEPTDKRRFYAEHQQEFTPLRYGGLVQFGMWLLRPRVVREFRNPQDDRVRFGRYFDSILAAVARVHDDPILHAFWRSGRVVANPLDGHPYQEAVPKELAANARWFLLDAAANPSRPWQLTTVLRIYALALERGSKPHREWLIYAFSPLDATIETEVKVPGGPNVRVAATVGGAFSVVSEDDVHVRRVGLTPE